MTEIIQTTPEAITEALALIEAGGSRADALAIVRGEDRAVECVACERQVVASEAVLSSEEPVCLDCHEAAIAQAARQFGTPPPAAAPDEDDPDEVRAEVQARVGAWLDR